MNDDEFDSLPVSEPEARPDVGEMRHERAKVYEWSTPEADAHLLAAYQAGRSVEELAGDFQRQPSAIEARLMKLALDVARKFRPGPPNDPGRC